MPPPKDQKIKQKPPSKRTRKPESAKPKAARLRGYLTWLYITGGEDGSYERFEVENALLRDGGKELVIDCDCHHPGDPPYVYTIILRREKPLLYRGNWTAGKAADREAGSCSCRLYFNGDQLAFVGAWKQDGETQHWMGELSPVE